MCKDRKAGVMRAVCGVWVNGAVKEETLYMKAYETTRGKIVTVNQAHQSQVERLGVLNSGAVVTCLVLCHFIPTNRLFRIF